MKTQFHIAVISLAAFLTLANYCAEQMHPFPHPLPPIKNEASYAMLKLFGE